MDWTVEAIAQATRGRAVEGTAPSLVVSRVRIDSRLVVPGDLFVPIVAERDGHDFIGSAIEAGAAAYLTNGPIRAGTAIRARVELNRMG